MPRLCVGSVEDPGDCVPEGQPIDFGNVAVTESATQRVVISNRGDATLVVSDISVTNDTPEGVLFDIEVCDPLADCVPRDEALGVELERGARRTVRITFHADTDGLFPAESLRVLHNDPTDDAPPDGVYLRPLVGSIDGCLPGFTDANGSIDDGCECEVIEGAEEFCDGIDNDCNGEVDDNVSGTGIACDTGLQGGCADGETACIDGSFGCAPLARATAEVCDGLDNNCDGAVDESGSWVSFSDGMSGGNMTDVAFDPRHPGVVYALTGNFIYRSENGGMSFDFAGEAPSSVHRISFPPNDDSALLATSTGGVLRSFDQGETWAVLSLAGLPVRAMMIHPADPAHVYVGANIGGGIYRSTNGGASFVPVNEGVAYSQVTDFLGDPSDVDVVVASSVLLTPQGTYDNAGQVLRTANGGTNWAVVLEDVGGVYGLSACAGAPSIVYAGVQTDGLQKSVDGGATWATASLGGNVLRDIFVAPSDCTTVYASLQPSGIHRSSDEGATFVGPLDAGMDVQFPGAMQLAVDPTAANRVLAVNHSGLFISENSGTTWVRPPEINAASVTDLAVTPADPGRVWLSAWGQGVWSRTIVQPWSKVSATELPRDFVFTVVPDPSDAMRVLVGSWQDLWLSEDGSASYVLTPQASNPLDVGFSAADPLTFYVSTQVGGIFKTTDGGFSWTPVNSGLSAPWNTGACVCQDVRDLWVDPQDSDRVVAGTNGKGVYRTEDGGQSWQLVTPQLSNEIVGCLTHTGGNLYACVSGEGLWASTDGGDSFTPVTQGNPELSNIGGLVVDEANGDLVATSDFGVFRSSDDGTTWEPVDNECLPTLGVGSPVIVDDGSSRRLVVATGGAGVYALPW